MTHELITILCETRLLVGFLGEKHQAGWWDSSFLSSASSAFLTPIFPKSMLLAKYNGVCQAASRLHDDSIGLGRHYHLYRLPDSIERLLAQTLQDQGQASELAQNISDRDTALSRLHEYCGGTVDKAEGPIAVGDFADKQLKELLDMSSRYYVQAFENNCQCFPYMRSS